MAGGRIIIGALPIRRAALQQDPESKNQNAAAMEI
jgi:hypothetical protein